MHHLIKLTAAAALLATGACASKPKPVEEKPAEVVKPVEPAPEVAPPAVTSSIIPGSLEDFRVNVGERVYFDLDQYRLDSEDQEILKRQAAWLGSYPGVRILVAGNCDERGTREYNLALGEQRANAVKEYLVSLGVAASRVDTVSYGKERPVVAGSDDQSWALNRNGWTQVVSGATS
jgi:peptidoglycan-associated lipoprotein